MDSLVQEISNVGITLLFIVLVAILINWIDKKLR